MPCQGLSDVEPELQRPWLHIRLRRPPPRYVPLVFSAGPPILPTKIKRQAEAGRPAERQWSKAAQPRLAADENAGIVSFLILFCLITIFDYLNIYDINFFADFLKDDYLCIQIGIR